MAWEVVIAGGGFGGFYAARELERLLPRHSARVTLVNDVNYMLYTPLLPGAAAGTLEPRHVVVPLREELRRTDLRLGEVTGADPDAGTVRVTAMDGRALELRYDHLIVALGSVSRTMNIPGLAEHAIGFKTLSQALELRNRLLQSFEAAEATENPEERAALLTFVFVGAGYAGLEGLAELQDFAADAIDLYPRCRVQGMRWLLVEGGPRVMGEIQPSLAAFAERELMSRDRDIDFDSPLAMIEGPQPNRPMPPPRPPAITAATQRPVASSQVSPGPQAVVSHGWVSPWPWTMCLIRSSRASSIPRPKPICRSSCVRRKVNTFGACVHSAMATTACCRFLPSTNSIARTTPFGPRSSSATSTPRRHRAIRS